MLDTLFHTASPHGDSCFVYTGFITEAEGAGDGPEPSAEATCQRRTPVTSAPATTLDSKVFNVYGGSGNTSALTVTVPWSSLMDTNLFKLTLHHSELPSSSPIIELIHIHVFIWAQKLWSQSHDSKLTWLLFESRLNLKWKFSHLVFNFFISKKWLVEIVLRTFGFFRLLQVNKLDFSFKCFLCIAV